MEIIHLETGKKYLYPKNLSLVLGYFDGVHIAHQMLIKEALKLSNIVGVLTFDNDFYKVIKKENEQYLTPLSDKAEIFSKLGVSYLFIVHFNSTLLYMTKDEFITNFINPINPSFIVVGDDFTFGFHKSGTYLDLNKYYKTYNFPIMKIDGVKIGSSLIKKYIRNGEIEKANKLLNRPYSISGIVCEGYKNGRKIGFPTANINLDENYVIPLEGVYLSFVYVGEKKLKAITSISTHPTINALAKPILETYIIDFDENIYGKLIKVEFIRYMRRIIKFPNLNELKKQLEKDKEFAKKHLQ